MNKRNQRFRPLLNNLLIDLLNCWQRKAAELLKVEASYMVTTKCWDEVKSVCWQDPFRSAEEEIYFFKNIKKQFTGRLAYYSLLYESLVSAPEDTTKTNEFWKGELQRFDRFMNKHRTFVEYLESGDTANDEQYFLRKNLVHQPVLKSKIYDGDPEYCTSQDYLVSALFAEKHYRQFVLSQISD